MIARRRNPRHLASPCGLDPAPEAMIRLEGNTKQALETARNRIVFSGIVFALAFSVISWRLGELSLSRSGNEPTIAREAAPRQLATSRAEILDRNGVVLATTLPTASLYANPRHVPRAEETAARLAAVLPGSSLQQLKRKLTSDLSYIRLEPNLTPREQYAVNRLGIPGLQFQREERRYYPQGALTSHVVGFTSLDNQGLTGMEKSFDDLLRGSAEPLMLSLDLRLQHILTEELLKSMRHFQAIGAAGLILDVESGEVLAMSSLPDFDPRSPGTASEVSRFNRATLGTYEMGSVFKIFTTAMALDRGVVNLSDSYDATDPIRVSGFTIRDYKPKKRRLSIPEIFIYSSNIGTVQMAMEAGTAMQQDFLGELGLLERASLEIGEVGAPQLPAPWREINTMTISYGHGLAVSPLQLASAVSAMVNGGEYHTPTLLKRDPSDRPQGRQVIGERTSRSMRDLMRLVVTEGTGGKANAPGYLVGGKTGTADKLSGRGYRRGSRIASFVAAFPMSEPRYVIFAMIDEPKGQDSSHGYATGGWVAAPVVRAVVERMAPMVGIEPVNSESADERGNRLLVRTSTRLEGHRVAAN